MLCRPARISGEAATIKTRITRRFGPFRGSNLPAVPSHAGLVSSRHEEIRNAADASLVHLWRSLDLRWIENTFPPCPAKCLRPSARLARLDCPARLPAKPVRTCGHCREAGAPDAG